MTLYSNVMVDLETLGTRADAVILSIGACCFGIDTDEISDTGFYTAISVDSNLASGRRIQEDTLQWWMKQSTAAQQVFHQTQIPLGDALEQLRDWFKDNAEPEACIWSNGADFDIPMLAHAYHSLGHETPWKFWNSRCVRTYKNLPIKIPKVPRTGVHHDALADAVYQARLVQAIHKKLSP